MTIRSTREIRHVRLSESRIQEIQKLVAGWPYETKAFMRARLNQYKPPRRYFKRAFKILIFPVFIAREKTFKILKDPEILTDWQMRFEVSGQTNPQAAWNSILETELNKNDYEYLRSLLNQELSDIHVPFELKESFNKIYKAHVRKEYLSDPTVPKAPVILVSGVSGSGKSATVRQALEEVIFDNRVEPEIDLKKKKEAVLAHHPVWSTLENVDIDLAMEIARVKKLKFYKFFSSIPLVRTIFRKKIGRNLSQLEEQGIKVDYSLITPNDYQTSLAGEPGNYFRRAMGDPRQTSIRHLEEAHSAFGKVEGTRTGVDSQQRTLIDTSNIILDEIISGQRDCLMTATTDQPERMDAAIYRRFVEKGLIIDVSEYWKNPDNIKAIVKMELLRSDIRVGTPYENAPEYITWVSEEELDNAVEKMVQIFKERTLKLIPSYLRKLVQSIIEIKGRFKSSYLDDSLLVRGAFELVAKNSYGDLFGRVVDKMDRKVKWEEYVGSIKNTFSEMANNCLFYGVNEEKGVVLNGPPGGGKTFLIRTWLSENKDVHDIATSPSGLQEPGNPVDGAVQNLEKVYDIAKMIAPTVVFFDEGDALAPKRSASGGNPSDKLTNKFLNLIDGEVPLNRVFTTLTTNRLDILDPALIRSKRLKVMEVSGHLRKEDIYKIIKQTLEEIPTSPEIDVKVIVDAAQGICNTPADYASFIEKARSLRNTEFEVVQRFRRLDGLNKYEQESFIKFNFKTLVGILDAVKAPYELRSKIKTAPFKLLEHYDEALGILKTIQKEESYPMMKTHLQSARTELAQSPIRKGKVQLDEFLEAELSKEPQPGFIIGVGANDVTGVLLPIATSLTYKKSPEKVFVTGAVSTSSGPAAEMDLAVKMTAQSAKEALTMVENYLQSVVPSLNVTRLLGNFMDGYSIHHQLLSASYNVGGPSAGYALAINTLSSLLNLPVYNDFGITGAPWIKGAKPGEVGSSVIIGGHKKKTEKVLLYLRRMFMPIKNYMDLDIEFLANYWDQDKDILEVHHFGDLLPEVLCLDEKYEKTLLEMISLRIELKRSEYLGNPIEEKDRKKVDQLKRQLSDRTANEIRKRLQSLSRFMGNPNRDENLSLEKVLHYSHLPVKIPQPVAGIRAKGFSRIFSYFQ